MRFVMTDGGRAAAGFKGSTGDCVTRAIAIAANKPYREVYDALNQTAKEMGDNFSSARKGVHRRVYDKYLKSIGAKWTATMSVGSGCQVHLSEDELPKGKIVARCSRHVIAVIDGVVHDNHDPSRDGRRCVYGYYTLP